MHKIVIINPMVDWASKKKFWYQVAKNGEGGIRTHPFCLMLTNKHFDHKSFLYNNLSVTIR
jgi:hypothetical protein